MESQWLKLHLLNFASRIVKARDGKTVDVPYGTDDYSTMHVGTGTQVVSMFLGMLPL